MTHLLVETSLVTFQLVFYLCLILSTTTTSQALSHTTWRRDVAFDDKTVTADVYDPGEYVLLIASSKAQCAVTCAQRPWCRSFFYSSGSARCHLHAIVFTDVSNATADEAGSRYYRYQAGEELEVPACPSSKGYVRDVGSGLCYKILETSYDHDQAQSACQADGGSLIMLDTVEKLQALLDILDNNPMWMGSPFFLGASRPLAEWNSPWTSSSTFFQWERTGESLLPLYQAEYFYDDKAWFLDSSNCVALMSTGQGGMSTAVFLVSPCAYTAEAICEYV